MDVYNRMERQLVLSYKHAFAKQQRPWLQLLVLCWGLERGNWLNLSCIASRPTTLATGRSRTGYCHGDKQETEPNPPPPTLCVPDLLPELHLKSSLLSVYCPGETRGQYIWIREVSYRRQTLIGKCIHHHFWTRLKLTHRSVYEIIKDLGMGI